MISTKDLFKEINKYDKLTKDDIEKIDDLGYKKAMIKIGVLHLKLLHNIRTNTVLVMEHFKIQKVKPKPRNNEEKTEKDRE